MAQLIRQISQLMMMSLWRRKSMMLAVVMCTAVVIICLQYSSVGGQTDNVSQQNLLRVNRRKNLPLGMEGPDQSASHKALLPRRNLSAVGLPNRNDGDGERNKVVGNGYAEIRSQNVNRRIPDPVIPNAEALDNNRLDSAANGHQKSYGGDRNSQNQWGQLQQGGWQQQAIANQQSGSTFIPPIRLVHFDLKGAPPKVSFYQQIFPLLKEAGANGILLEYEDMFPYWGPLAETQAGNAYKKEDIEAILKEAKTHNFEVIPLIQTFGHLEYALKLEKYRKLREVDDFPQAICPSKNDSFTLVKNIVDQVISFHPNIKWMHIGCDEVYHLGYCSKCMQQDRENLFLTHVARVAKYVRERHNVIPIIWDDMLRQIPSDKLKHFKLGSLVEPMIWTYVKDIYRFIPYNVWLTYSEVFPFVWGASAYKGAFGETLTVPNVRMHLENHEAWLEVMAEQQKRFQSIRGLALTGWQRYDHFGALCELLPSGMPSLFVNLISVSLGQYSQTVFTKFNQILQCTTRTRAPVDFENDPYLWQKASGCFFPGSGVFRMTQHHSDAIKRINDYLYDVTIHKAWLTEYNVRRNMTSPMRVDEGLTDYSSNYYPLTSLIRTARDALREVYDEYTVAEWIEQNIYPYIAKMEKLWRDGTELKKAKTWPKRPLPPLEDLKRFQVGDLNAQKNEDQQKK